MLALENITGGYDATRDILSGASLKVRRGESVGIIGLNGSGKSTLGKAVMNMLPRRAGRVMIDGVDVTSFSTSRLASEGIGHLMQGAPVFDQLTVAENLQLAAHNNKHVLGEATQRLAKTFPKFFTELRHRRADKLSGGERHQLALCLALVKQAKLLILDEPSAGLDPAAAKALYQTLAKVREETGVTILLVEQNVNLAREFCDRILVMREGRLEEAEGLKPKGAENTEARSELGHRGTNLCVNLCVLLCASVFMCQSPCASPRLCVKFVHKTGNNSFQFDK